MGEHMARDPGHNLTNRVALVTGAGSGIGRGIAQRLAAFGAQVVVADVNDPTGRETVQMVESAGGAALFKRTDVSIKSEADAMVAAALEHFGRVDYLVNNAGIVTMTPFLDLPEEEWDLVMNVNLIGSICPGSAAPGRYQSGLIGVWPHFNDLPLDALPDRRREPLDRRGFRVDCCLEVCHCCLRCFHPAPASRRSRSRRSRASPTMAGKP